VAGFVPSDARGRAYGLYHAAAGMAALPASPVFGVVWKGLGPATAFAIGAPLAAAALLLTLLLATRNHRTA
jgi:predicted MFS family arabinose efflux permease